MTIPNLKKLILLVSISILIVASISGQNIFSVIHLNDKEDIQYGNAKNISWKLTDFETEETSTSKGSKILNHKNQVVYDFEDNSWQSVVITDFDSTTGLVKSRTFNRKYLSGDLIKEKQIFKYDGNNFLVEIFTLDKDGQIFLHTMIKNNEWGLPVESVAYNADGTLHGGREKAEYLPDENMYILKVYSSEKVLLSSTKEILNFNDNYKFNNSDNEYNKSGDIIKSFISEDGYILHSYKYDDHSNWIEYRVYEVTFSRKGRERKNLINIYKRNIEYWE